MIIEVKQDIMEAYKSKAAEIRKKLDAAGVTMINIIGSPGAGKTTIIEKTLAGMKANKRIAVIEGDVDTARDAQRLQQFEIPLVSINTSGACHLQSALIEQALDHFTLQDLDLVIIENVGNLICPAEFDLGEHAKVAVISVPEGDDKPLKYPMIFRESKAVILNKVDLIEYTNFRREVFLDDLKNLNASIPLFEISSTKEEGLEEWFSWLGELT